MLNNERQFTFNDCSRPWYKHPEIPRIKKKYEIEKHEDNKAFLAANPEATKEVRVSIPGSTIEEIIDEGNRLILDEGVEATTKLGHIATILLTLLFAIRASTVGDLLSDEDVWLDASGHLCMIIRFVKCWVTGQQKSTGKKLPIKRVGHDSIPPGGRGEHPRSQSIAIVMKAKRRRAICWLPGNDLDRPYQAAKAIGGTTV
jgi:hypothetical protein